MKNWANLGVDEKMEYYEWVDRLIEIKCLPTMSLEEIERKVRRMYYTDVSPTYKGFTDWENI